MPISVATPQIAYESIPQSRSTMSSGVPANADMVTLSSTSSLGRGSQLRHQLEAGGVAQQERLHVGHPLQPLPDHRRAQRRHPGHLRGQEVVPQVDDPEAAGPRRVDQPADPLGDLGGRRRSG